MTEANTDNIILDDSQIATPAPRKDNFLQKVRKKLRDNLGAIIILWIPTFCTAFYYFGMATDMYESEARFIVRSPQQSQMSSLSSLLQTTGFAPSMENLFAVHDFISSRDAIAAIQDSIDLKKVYNKPNADFLSRYPNILHNDSNEGFFEYYSKQVSVIYDSTTSITILKVKAFEPEEARKIADLLLLKSEELVNRLNERSGKNAINEAEKEVSIAEERITDIQLKMLQYRNREEVLDPKTATKAYAETLAKLRVELIMSRARLSELQQTSPSNPAIDGLKTRINAIQRQYNSEKAKLTGDEKSLAPKVGMYEELVLRQEFAAKQLASAVLSLESARAEARRQQLYLDRIVEPSSPDEAAYPQRVKSLTIAFISFFLTFAISKLMLTGIREHSQR